MLIGEKFTGTALTCNSRFNNADELKENIRNFLLVNLLNKISVWLCQFLTLSHMYHAQYMLLTLASDLQFLQLHKVGSQFFPGLHFTDCHAKLIGL